MTDNDRIVEPDKKEKEARYEEARLRFISDMAVVGGYSKPAFTEKVKNAIKPEGIA